MPCAGTRIPNGALTGLLAWRLVVRLAPPAKEKRGYWNDRSSSYSEPTVHTPHYTGAPISYSPYTSVSALSLPLTRVLSPTGARDLHDFSQKVRPSSVVLTRQPHFSKIHPQAIRPSQQLQPQLHQTSPPISNNAHVVNFILDTSLPYSIISRDTLVALGYPILHLLANMPLAMVTLSIQNIPTRFHIARPNEASRLGVQFLHDAGVSVFFPKDGQGVGPVFYGKFFFFVVGYNNLQISPTIDFFLVESAHLLKDVPRTISARQKFGVKLTLAQRVRALFGYPTQWDG